MLPSANQDPDTHKTTLTRLGLLGLIPFLFGVLAVWISPLLLPTRHFALEVHNLTLAYGGIIAAYMAGMGAGGLIAGPGDEDSRLLPGMLGALTAWIAVSPSLPFGLYIDASWRYFMVLIVLLFLLWRDLRAVQMGGLPAWYAPLRIRLTFWASLSIIAIMSRLILWGY